jgi:hypothetical protein
MASKGEFLVLRGVLNYAKIIGEAKPHTGLPKYDKGPNWSLELTPDPESVRKLEKAGCADKLKKLKKPDPNRVGSDPFLRLSILEKRSDGKKNSAPKVMDAQGNDWDSRLIGNGTEAVVQVKVVDYGSDSEKGVYYQKAKIMDLVPYGDDERAESDDEFFSEGASDIPASSFDAEDEMDDVPF